TSTTTVWDGSSERITGRASPRSHPTHRRTLQHPKALRRFTTMTAMSPARSAPIRPSVTEQALHGVTWFLCVTAAAPHVSVMTPAGGYVGSRVRSHGQIWNSERSNILNTGLPHALTMIWAIDWLAARRVRTRLN